MTYPPDPTCPECDSSNLDDFDMMEDDDCEHRWLTFRCLDCGFPTCWADDCNEAGTDRFVAKPIPSFSLAGAQMKVAATRVRLCDDHWQAHLDAAVPS